MGIVYEAHDQQRNMTVALKTLRHVEATSLYRLKREFRAISDLCHPNIITLYELVADEDAWFFTMELINGQSIIDHVRDGRPGVADVTEPGRDHVHPLPPVGEVVDVERLRDAFGQLASALTALHEIGLVHRDLKPSNVLVTDSGRVVLMDFGIVAEASEGHARATVTVGTPAYMAPEQAAGDPPTAAADWYAFGAMLYLALADRLPFGGTAVDILRSKLTRRPVPVDMMVADIPADLQRMCVRLLTRRPEHRMAAGDVLASLGVGAGADASAGPEPHWAAGQRLFVGRACELDELRAAFASVRAGQPVSVFIRGETGVGKSALLRRFLDEIAPQHGQGRGPVVLRGRCHERESLPYNGLDGLIDSLSHALLSLPSHTLAGLLPANAAPLGRLFPVLLRIPHIAGADYTEADEHEPLALRDRGARALYELIAALARLQPVIICLEDLHWADRDSCDLLLAMRGTPAPILLLGTVSTDSIDSVDNSGIRSIRSPRSIDVTGPEVRLTAESEVDIRLESELGSRVEIERMIHRMIGAHWDCRQLTLDPLSTADRRQLLSGLVKRQRTSLEPLLSHSGRAGTANDILAEASGNPLLLMDMVRLLDESDGAIELGNLDFDTLLGARLARLPAEARALLHAVAVAGEPIALDIAGHAAKLSAEERERAAALLRRSQLLRWVKPGSEKRLVIQHTRVRDAIRDSLPCKRKAALHRRFARALEGSDKTTVDQLARHWRAAGNREKARGYQILAAEKAETALAFDRAAALYQAALDLTDPQGDGARAPILQRLGGALQLAGRGYEAAQIYELAAAATDGEQALELNRLAADSWLRSGRIDNGLRRLAQVLGGLGVSYPRTRRSALLSLLLRRAQLALRGRRYRSRDAAEIPARDLARLDILYAAATTLGFLDYLRGADLQTRHLLAALRLGEAHRTCRALAIDSAFLAASGGRGVRKGRVLGDQMLAQARRQGDPYVLGIVQLTRGGMMLFNGHTVEAVATLAECDALLSRVRYAVAWERSTARYLRALARILSGDLAGAARMTERYVRDAESRHDVYARSLFLCIPGTWALLCADQPETADSRLDSALDGWPAGRFYMVHYLYVFARIMVRLYCGDGQGAMDLLHEHLLPRTRRLLLMRVPAIRGDVYALIGRAALMLGDQATVRASIRVIRRARLPYCNGMALLLEGSLRGHRGDRRGTEEALTAARECFAAASAPHMVAACELRLGMLTGGSHGEELRSRGDAALRELGVVNPERILELFVPGFPA